MEAMPSIFFHLAFYPSTKLLPDLLPQLINLITSSFLHLFLCFPLFLTSTEAFSLWFKRCFSSSLHFLPLTSCWAPRMFCRSQDVHFDHYFIVRLLLHSCWQWCGLYPSLPSFYNAFSYVRSYCKPPSTVLLYNLDFDFSLIPIGKLVTIKHLVTEIVTVFLCADMCQSLSFLLYPVSCSVHGMQGVHGPWGNWKLGPHPCLVSCWIALPLWAGICPVKFSLCCLRSRSIC